MHSQLQPVRRMLWALLLVSCSLLLMLLLPSSGVLCASAHSHKHHSAAAAVAPQPAEITDDLTYDFIVVGGGITGSIVAARLAQAVRPDGTGQRFRVLLLEAGGATQANLGGNEVRKAWKGIVQEQRKQQRHTASSNNLTSIPRLPLPTVFDVPLEWHTVLGVPGLARRYEWEVSLPSPSHPRPAIVRGLGGCSVHNAMVYVRGVDEDFDVENKGGEQDIDDDDYMNAANGTTLSEASAAPPPRRSRHRHTKHRSERWPAEWSFESVLPFYRRSVQQRDAALASLPQHQPFPVDESQSGGGGGEVYLSSVHPDDIDPFSRRVLAAWSGEATDDDHDDAGGDDGRKGKSARLLLPRLTDMNDPQRREGVALYQFLIRDGRRDTAAQQLFGNQLSADDEAAQKENNKEEKTDSTRSSANRRNRAPQPGALHVRTNVQATRILFERDAATGIPRAVGVEVVLFRPGSYAASSGEGSAASDSDSEIPAGASPLPPHSAPIRLRARFEVIVSAGAINSPKLLLQSGVGPRTHLRRAGVPLVAALDGVGENLMDGAKTLLQYRARHGARYRPCMFEERDDVGGLGFSSGTTSGQHKAHKHHEQALSADGKHTGNSTAVDFKLHKKRCALARRQWLAGQQQAALQRASPEGESSTEQHPISYGEFGTPGFAVGAFIRSSPAQRLPNVQLTLFPFDVAQRDWASAGPDAFRIPPSASASSLSSNPSPTQTALGSAADSGPPGDIDLVSGGGGVLTVEMILNNPRSRGSVRLQLDDKSKQTEQETEDAAKAEAAATSEKERKQRHHKAAASASMTDEIDNPVSPFAQALRSVSASASHGAHIKPDVASAEEDEDDAWERQPDPAVAAARLASSLLPPRVSIGSFSAPEDVSAMLDSLRLVRELMSSPALVGSHVGAELLPGAQATEEEMKDYIRCGAKQFRPKGISCPGTQRIVNHLAGTCRMGGQRVHIADLIVQAEQDAAKAEENEAEQPYSLVYDESHHGVHGSGHNRGREPVLPARYMKRGSNARAAALVREAVATAKAKDSAPSADDGSVVDPFLRVHGVLGLRVADASIMPVLPSGNTAATCMMIGERTAHFLIEQYAEGSHGESNSQSGDSTEQQSAPTEKHQSHHQSHHAAASAASAAAASPSSSSPVRRPLVAPLPPLSSRASASDRIILRDMECPLSAEGCHIASLRRAAGLASRKQKRKNEHKLEAGHTTFVDADALTDEDAGMASSSVIVLPDKQLPLPNATDASARPAPATNATEHATATAGAATATGSAAPPAPAPTTTHTHPARPRRHKSTNQRTREEIVRHEAAGTEEAKAEEAEEEAAERNGTASAAGMEDPSASSSDEPPPPTSWDQDRSTYGVAHARSDVHSTADPRTHTVASAESPSGFMLLILGTTTLLLMLFLLHHVRSTQTRNDEAAAEEAARASDALGHPNSSSDPRRPLLAGLPRRSDYAIRSQEVA